MKKIITFTLILISILTVQSREYIIRQVLPDVGYYETQRTYGPFIIDLGNYYPKLMMHNPCGDDWYRTVAYRFTGDSFELEIMIDTLHITASGDFDNDGLPELLGYSVAYDRKIAVMEQPDTNQIYTARTWESDSLNYGCVALGSTDLIKTDGIDRIYGSDPQNSDDGWYYMSMNGDNSYYFDYELIEDREISTMDIGYLDDDSLVDVIAGTSKGQTVWESKSMSNDSFEMKLDNLGWGLGTHYSGILKDIDNDGRNEFITGGQNFLMSPCEWSFTIGECIDDTTYNRILLKYFSKDYGFKENYYSGSDYDIGDIDGDGDDEIIVCAGCMLRVYEVVGNDSFVQVWEMDNDTFSGSHVRVYDFNENGIDEIIWSGASDPFLPLTWDIIERHTYIIENAPISKLSYNNPYDMGDKPLSTTITDSLYLKAIDELPVIIDSMKLLKQRNITLNEPTYPCSIPAYDSLPILFDIYSDTSAFITDTLIVYSNDWYGNIDTIELNAGIGAQIVIDSAIASDNRNTQSGVDYDDYVRLYFNYPIDTPDTSTVNLDSILPLSNNHTWYDGTGNIKQINYTRNNTVMTIWLSTDTSIPTVLVGDSIYPDTASITDKHYYSYLKDPVMITGSFGPTGIGDNNNEQEDIIITITFNAIQIQNNTNKTQTYQITDITGRMIDNITVKKGLNTYTPTQSGIYFVINKNKNIIKKAIIVK